MKKIFTKEFIMKNRGCYSKEMVEAFSFINKKVITIYDIAYSEISIMDLLWFLYEKCLIDESFKEYILQYAVYESNKCYNMVPKTDSNYNRRVLVDFIDKNI